MTAPPDRLRGQEAQAVLTRELVEPPRHTGSAVTEALTHGRSSPHGGVRRLRRVAMSVPYGSDGQSQHCRSEHQPRPSAKPTPCR